jgi:2,4-dienoyl-CoA reductase-like NADH-dependent reductase (Old Yellow Enzyme family)
MTRPATPGKQWGRRRDVCLAANGGGWGHWHARAGHPLNKDEMTPAFTPGTINTLTQANRFVRSAVWEGLANDDGTVTDALTALYAELARGGAGLIISSHAYVSEDGQAGPWQLGAYSDALLPGLRRLVDAAHDGGCPLFLQLAHAGAHAAVKLTGQAAIGPAAFAGRDGDPARPMNDADIHRVTAAMAAAARRAQAAGFDGVQIHAAHGYLLSQFLSPATNPRSDGYGGDTAKRARLTLEVAAAVRSAVGPDFPVAIKINSEDFTPEGMGVGEMVDTVALLADSGIDAVELSGGLVTNPQKTHCARREHPAKAGQEAYYRAAARAVKARVDLPLMLVGGIRTPDVADRLVESRTADFISFGRPLIAEPNLVGRWAAGDRSRADCISCNKCYEPLLAGRGVACVVKQQALAAGKSRKAPAGPVDGDH